MSLGVIWRIISSIVFIYFRGCLNSSTIPTPVCYLHISQHLSYNMAQSAKKKQPRTLLTTDPFRDKPTPEIPSHRIYADRFGDSVLRIDNFLQINKPCDNSTPQIRHSNQITQPRHWYRRRTKAHYCRNLIPRWIERSPRSFKFNQLLYLTK